jgi:polyphosphate kinase
MKPPRHLLTAPFRLHRQMLRYVEQVAGAAREGRPARIVLKMNALTDVPLIEALSAASRAGARIDLVVRGACTLPPGLPGLTETIRVRSIVGRFLEHTRAFYFRWGEGDDDEALYLSSADWMGRNMFRRIEAAWPVRDARLRQRVIDECLVPYLYDDLDAWELRPDGRYERATAAGPGLPNGRGRISAQSALMLRFAAGTH